MSFRRSERAGEAQKSDNDQNDGPGVAEIKITAAQFREQKKQSDGDNNDWPFEAANCATLTTATNLIAHR